MQVPLHEVHNPGITGLGDTAVVSSSGSGSGIGTLVFWGLVGFAIVYFLKPGSKAKYEKGKLYRYEGD